MEGYQPAASGGGGIGPIERLMHRNERWMYRGRRPNRAAAFLNGIWARVGAAGLLRGRLVTLDVVGRRSGEVMSVPLIVADHGGERYLVAMLGERADWIANVRAAGGRAVLRHGRREAVTLDEVEPARRGPIVRRHLEVAPAARSFAPGGGAATPAELDRYAIDIPVFRIRGRLEPETAAPTRQPRRRRRRWVVAGLAALAVVLVVAFVTMGTRSGPPPFALPAAAAAPPVGTLDGRWTPRAGSMAGFRVEQIALGMHADVVGRSPGVSGTVDAEGNRVARASFTVDLTTLTVNDKPQPQLDASLDTAANPRATVTLVSPLVLPEAVVGGDVGSVTADGTLELHGVTRPVTISLNVRRDGPAIEAVGSMPLDFSRWNVETPAGYGVLGSLADHGVAEFYLVLGKGAG